MVIVILAICGKKGLCILLFHFKGSTVQNIVSQLGTGGRSNFDRDRFIHLRTKLVIVDRDRPLGG